MAITNPIPAPPRTPTPPPDDGPSEMRGLGLDGIGDLLSPTNDGYDPHALSPMSENFAAGRYGSSPPKSLSGRPLGPASPNSLYSSISADSNGTSGSQDGKNPFNFQPMSLAKSPVMKSVSICVYVAEQGPNETSIRVSVSDGVTNTNTVAYPTRSSSNLRLERRLRCLTPSMYPPSRNAGAACPASRKHGSGGASATWWSPPTRSGALRAPWH